MIDKLQIRPAPILQWDAAIIACALLLAPFFSGFRPTADQKEYALVGMTTPPWTWPAHAWPLVSSQGRIGDFIWLPLEYMTGRIGDMWFYPFLCVAVLLTIVVSLATWWAILNGSRAILAPVLVYVALLPAGFHHWLPNAYPMMAVPLALSLAAKAAMLHGAAGGKRLLLNLVCCLLIFAGALTFELNLAVLAILYVSEIAFLLSARRSGANSPVTPPYLVWNGITLALAGVIWGAFRYAYGSNYEGNAYPADALSWETVAVTILHLWTASLAAWKQPILLLHGVPWQTQLAMAAVLLLVTIAFYKSRKAARPWIWIVFGTVLAIGATLPISMVSKFHQWCLQAADCSYIDGRLSLVGIAIALVGLLSLLPAKPVLQTLAAAIVGLAAAESFLQNVESYAARREAFEGRELLAKRYVCGDQSLGLSNEAVADRLTDETLVSDRNSFHPWHDMAWRKNYWLTYIDHLQHSRFWLCPGA